MLPRPACPCCGHRTWLALQRPAFPCPGCRTPLASDLRLMRTLLAWALGPLALLLAAALKHQALLADVAFSVLLLAVLPVVWLAEMAVLGARLRLRVQPPAPAMDHEKGPAP